MGKINLNILLIAIVGLAVIASGCTGGQDVTSVVKALPEVQQFMKEHPNAQITVTYWSKEEIAQSAQEISRQCDKPITPVAMYKATVSEGELKIVSWINAENQIVICSTTGGKGGSTSNTFTPTSTPTATLVAPTPVITTTSQATATIAENLVIESVDGNSFAGTTLTALNIVVRPASGSPDIDLSKVTLKVKTQSYNYSTGTGSQTSTFRVFVLRDPDGVLGGTIGSYTSTASPALRTGALARIDADVSALNIQSKNSISIALTRERGTTFTMQLSLPTISTGTNAIYP